MTISQFLFAIPHFPFLQTGAYPKQKSYAQSKQSGTIIKLSSNKEIISPFMLILPDNPLLTTFAHPLSLKLSHQSYIVEDILIVLPSLKGTTNEPVSSNLFCFR